MNFIFAFVTGLTAGGLGCLAVQGGLLTGSLANQLELDQKAANGRIGADLGNRFRPRILFPVLLFLLAKLASYTALGFLLGASGSLIQLSPPARAALMIVIGIFILGNGLRMLDLHPISRWFVIETPSTVTRFIRLRSQNGASFFTPLFLGALTVLLPCGVAQAMMAAALAS